MVEDAEERHLVHIWTWIMIFAFCSAFFAPVGGWFVNRFVLSAKAIVLYIFSHETARGIQRMEETKHRSLAQLLSEYRSVFFELLHSKPILAALSLMIITNIYTTVSNNFWGVLFTTKLGFAESEISVYVAIRSVVMTLGFFLLGPSLTNIRRYRTTLWIGFGTFILSKALLVFMPPHSIPLLSLSVVLEGVAVAFVNPMTESLLAVSMESNERARVTAMVYVALILVISPFGWIAGQLSAIDRALPFALNAVMPERVT